MNLAKLVAVVSTLGVAAPVLAQETEGTSGAQEAGGAAGVSVDVEHLGGAVHLLRIGDGEPGWVNAAVLVSEGDAVLVDHAGDWRTLSVAREVVAEVRAALTDLEADSVTHVVNTHWHGDHTAGNPHFPGALIVAHARTRDRLAARQSPWWYPEGMGPMEEAGLPDLVFERSMTLHVGSERVHLWHFGPAHTDGDAVVYFENARVAHMGDLYHGLTDPSVGEDMDGIAVTLGEAAARMHPDTRVVTGHGGVTSVDDLVAYRDMLSATLDHVRAQLSAGADLDQILASGLPPAWTDTLSDPDAVVFWLTEIHRSLTGP